MSSFLFALLLCGALFLLFILLLVAGIWKSNRTFVYLSVLVFAGAVAAGIWSGYNLINKVYHNAKRDHAAREFRTGTAFSKSTKVDDLVSEKMAEDHIPGLSLAVVKEGRIIYAKGYGKINLELARLAKPESNYLIASVTKTFTAVAVMMLWEKGRLKLDDKIGKYLDNLPAQWNQLTIRQLLSHTSGIPSNLDPDPPCKFIADLNDYTRADYIKEVACLPLNFAPGTKWEYSGSSGYMLLGMLIEKISRDSYWTFLEKNIFSTLSMHDTGPMDYSSIIENRASGYQYDSTTASYKNSEQLDPIGEFASGGLRSTVLDLAKFDEALSAQKLLKQSTLDSMFTPARLNDGTLITSYGLGFGLTPHKGNKRVGHTGGTPGFSSSFNCFPDKRVTVIILSNTNHPGYNVLEFSNKIAELYF